MRIEIKTEHPVKDCDIRALYVIAWALCHIQSRMIVPTLRFFADKYGYTLFPK